MSAIPPSAVEKFNRAQEHFEGLKREIDAFLRPESYRTRSEPNADFTEYRFYVEFEDSLPSVRWGLIFGDGVHCLRSALDHCVHAIGVKEGGENPPPDERVLAFPTTKDEAQWESARWHVRSLSEEVRAEIKRLQPHGEPDEFVLRPLGGLQELDNTDKHRAIRIVTTVPIVEESNLSGLVGGQKIDMDVRIGPLSNAPFVTIALDRPTWDVEVRNNLSFAPGVPHIRQSGQETTLLIWPCIDAMNKAVTDVLTALAEFCQ